MCWGREPHGTHVGPGCVGVCLGGRLAAWPGKGLAGYLDVHLVVSRPVDGSIEPKAHHKDALADREPAEGTACQMDSVRA